MCVCVYWGQLLPAVILPLNQPVGAKTDTKTHTHTHSQCITSSFHLFVSALAKSKTSMHENLRIMHENHTEILFHACCSFNVMDLSWSSKQRLSLAFYFEDLDTFFSLGWSDWCLSLVLDDINELLMDPIHSSFWLNSVFFPHSVNVCKCTSSIKTIIMHDSDQKEREALYE